MPVCFKRLLRIPTWRFHLQIYVPANCTYYFPGLRFNDLDPMASRIAAPHLDMTGLGRFDCYLNRSVYRIEEFGERVVGCVEGLEVNRPYFVELDWGGNFGKLKSHS